MHPTHPVKFALYSRSGEEIAWLLAEPIKLKPPKLTKKMKHHIIVVDRSGSMWNDMDGLKAILEQVLVVQGVKDPMLKMTLISYSSVGDMTVHFQRALASDVLDPKQGFTQKIRSLRPTSLTCISQALEAALGMVQSGETTCISLHSDGYANDASPTMEKRAIEVLLEKYRKVGGVCIDTLAWRASSDFVFLQKIATTMSGKCILANDARQVEKMLRETTARLAGEMVPCVMVEKENDECDWIALHSTSAGRINGIDGDLTVDGLSPKDDVHVWRYHKLSKGTFSVHPAVRAENVLDLAPVYLYAASRVMAGDLFLGKAAMLATRDVQVLQHLRAMTPVALHALQAEMQEALDHPDQRSLLSTWGVGQEGLSVLEVVELLRKHRGAVSVDLSHPVMSTGYTRRSLVRLSGAWGKDGRLVAPATRLVPEGGNEAVSISDFVVNQSEATIQMTTHQLAQLVSWDGKQEYRSIEGVSLRNLKMFRSYTIFADGAAHVEALPLRFTRAGFEHLREHLEDVDEFTPFDAKKTWLLPLSQRAAVPKEDEIELPNLQMVQRMYEAKIVVKILTALVGQDAPSADWTPEQVEALRAHCLTPALYWSAPSVTPWPAANRDEAIHLGLVDFQTRYHVVFGLPDLHGPEALHSGNELLQRHATVSGIEGASKPKWPMLWQPNAVMASKAPGPGMKVTSADTLGLPFVQGMISTWRSSTLHAETSHLGSAVHIEGWGKMPEALRIEAIKDVLKRMKQYEDTLMSEHFNAPVLYIGSTGLLPGKLQREKLETGEQIEARGIKLGKAEKDGSFLLTPQGVLVAIYAENDLYTTAAGREAVKRMQVVKEEST